MAGEATSRFRRGRTATFQRTAIPCMPALGLIGIGCGAAQTDLINKPPRPHSSVRCASLPARARPHKPTTATPRHYPQPSPAASRGSLAHASALYCAVLCAHQRYIFLFSWVCVPAQPRRPQFSKGANRRRREAAGLDAAARGDTSKQWVGRGARGRVVNSEPIPAGCGSACG